MSHALPCGPEHAAAYTYLIRYVFVLWCRCSRQVHDSNVKATLTALQHLYHFFDAFDAGDYGQARKILEGDVRPL